MADGRRGARQAAVPAALACREDCPVCYLPKPEENIHLAVIEFCEGIKKLGYTAPPPGRALDAARRDLPANFFLIPRDAPEGWERLELM